MAWIDIGFFQENILWNNLNLKVALDRPIKMSAKKFSESHNSQH